MPLISRTEEVAVYSDRSYKKFEQVQHTALFSLGKSSLCQVVQRKLLADFRVLINTIQLLTSLFNIYFFCFILATHYVQCPNFLLLVQSSYLLTCASFSLSLSLSLSLSNAFSPRCSLIMEKRVTQIFFFFTDLLWIEILSTLVSTDRPDVPLAVWVGVRATASPANISTSDSFP